MTPTTWPHDSSCRICRTVDEWLAQRKQSRRPATGNRAAANAAAPDGENAPEVAPDGGSARTCVCGASYSEHPATRSGPEHLEAAPRSHQSAQGRSRSPVAASSLDSAAAG